MVAVVVRECGELQGSSLAIVVAGHADNLELLCACAGSQHLAHEQGTGFSRGCFRSTSPCTFRVPPNSKQAMAFLMSACPKMAGAICWKIRSLALGAAAYIVNSCTSSALHKHASQCQGNIAQYLRQQSKAFSLEERRSICSAASVSAQAAECRLPSSTHTLCCQTLLRIFLVPYCKVGGLGRALPRQGRT